MKRSIKIQSANYHTELPVPSDYSGQAMFGGIVEALLKQDETFTVTELLETDTIIEVVRTITFRKTGRPE